MHNLAHQKTKKAELASTFESINKDKGPFKTQFDKVLDSFKLERTVYHSGALVGNDVNKVTKTENISKICDVIKPKTVTLASGIKKIFGSYELAQVLKTRFIKFRDCYQLYMENRHLCRHEVLKLCEVI